jgi:hypothetical protein
MTQVRARCSAASFATGGASEKGDNRPQGSGTQCPRRVPFPDIDTRKQRGPLLTDELTLSD